MRVYACANVRACVMPWYKCTYTQIQFFGHPSSAHEGFQKGEEVAKESKETALHSFQVCMPYMYALRVCFRCILHMYALYVCALYVCLIRMSHMCALCARYVCLICVPYAQTMVGFLGDVCLICMPYTYAFFVLCALHACLVCMPYMYALHACLRCMPYMHALCVWLKSSSTTSRHA